jgi:hypothetical protein
MDATFPVPLMKLPGSVKLSATGLQLPDGMSRESWATLGQSLRQLEGALPWFCGDWLAWGKARFGEDYVALHIQGWDRARLLNCGAVSERIPPPQRNAQLHFSYHCEVLDLSSKDRSRWLSKAVRSGMSLPEFRRALRRSLSDNPTGDEEAALPRGLDAFGLRMNVLRLVGQLDLRKASVALLRSLLPLVSEMAEKLSGLETKIRSRLTESHD